MRFTMKSGIAVAFLFSIPSFAAIGCGDDTSEPDLLTLADFEGSWEVQMYKVTQASNQAVSMELISMGASFDWVADDAGHFTGGAFIPAALAGQDLDLDVQGTFTLIGQDSVVVNFIPEMPPFLTHIRGAFQYSGSTMTIIDRNTTFDFGTGVEAAIFEGLMARN